MFFEKDTDAKIAELEEIYHNFVIQKTYAIDEFNVTSVQYAVGGDGVHRGYYHPSPVGDLVIGNVNRGKKLKRPTMFSNIKYEYSFSSDDKLLLAKEFVKFPHFTDVIVENFIYEQIDNSTTRRIGVGMSKILPSEFSVSIEYFSDKRIIEYATGFFVTNNNTGKTEIHQISCEKYDYDKSGMKSCMIDQDYIYDGFLSDERMKMCLDGLGYSIDILKNRPYPLMNYSLIHNDEGFLTAFYPVAYTEKVLSGDKSQVYPISSAKAKKNKLIFPYIW